MVSSLDRDFSCSRGTEAADVMHRFDRVGKENMLRAIFQSIFGYFCNKKIKN